MRCSSCQAELAGEPKYCSECGYNIKSGAHGYNTRGDTDWGVVDRHLATLEHVMLGLKVNSEKFGALMQILQPLWDGTKLFCVQEADLIQIEEPPPPNPTIHITFTILVYSDGSIDVNGVHFPPPAI